MPYWSMNDMLTSGRDAAAKWGYKADGVEDVLKLIIDAPIIKAESIKHGKWIFKNGYLGNTYYCSECEKAVYLNKYGEPNLTDFCPDCGARMDGGGINEKQQDKEGGV